MKNLAKYSLLDKVTYIRYDGADVQIRFDKNSKMYWKMNTNDSISFGCEKVSYKDLNDSLSSISWREDSGVSVNLVLNFISQKLIAIWTSDKDINAMEGQFKILG
jgi:hypothetical protein